MPWKDYYFDIRHMCVEEANNYYDIIIVFSYLLYFISQFGDRDTNS